MWHTWLAFTLLGLAAPAADPDLVQSFQPKGKIHIPIGIPNDLDTLKTFVEAEGNFSPGFGSYGVFFALKDPANGKVVSPTDPDVPCERGLTPEGYPIPWVAWRAGDIRVRQEICQAQVPARQGALSVVATRINLTNTGKQTVSTALLLQLQSLGAAGGPVGHAFLGDGQIDVQGNTAVVWDAPFAGFNPNNTISYALGRFVNSSKSDARIRVSHQLELEPGETKSFDFISPVLAGRVAVRHEWDGKSPWAQLDLADPIAGEQGERQPEVDAAFCRTLKFDDLKAEAVRLWKSHLGVATLQLPDQRWNEAFAAIAAHVMIAMNEGAPDVSVINYNVFNRDGVYVANILQKRGNFALAEAAIDYFLSHPFNGRIKPEADNPGQILWIMGEHWKFTRNREWLKRVYPAARKLAAMIRYYRTTPGPHWVNPASLEFGEALPSESRVKLEPGACDGFHPEYTEAFDVAGLRGAAVLAEALGNDGDRTEWSNLAEELMRKYDAAFGADLRKHEYGNYCVLWPCRLYPLEEGRGAEQFRGIGAESPTSWRYFPLARAHQGLLAGNRIAGHGTLRVHLDHEQMRGWYAFDEGGPSGPGNWPKVISNWKAEQSDNGRGPLAAAAMPHGWAIAELHLLLRDSLLFEDNETLVLFAGIPEDWFKQPMVISGMPTHFGTVSSSYSPGPSAGKLKFSCSREMPKRVVVRTPKGDVTLPAGATEVEIPL